MLLVKCIYEGFCSELTEGNYYFVECDCFRDCYYLRGSFGVLDFGKHHFVTV